MIKPILYTTFTLTLLVSSFASAQKFAPGARTLLDAHNCYPYDGEYVDRIDRALATGTPVAIEQDLVWYDDPETGRKRSIVSHGKPFSGEEPSIENHFFERIRPIMEAAIKSGDKSDWPLITLNVDYKSSDMAHVEDNYRVFSQYADWMTYAIRTDTPEKAEPLTVGPLLVLLGSGPNKRTVFHDNISVGGKIIAFGAVSLNRVDKEGLSRREATELDSTIDQDQLLDTPASNYYRWWNDSWYRIESGGASRSRDWTKTDQKRLKTIVKHAHKLGYWLRLYTLNGHTAEESQGWFGNYNFGSLDDAKLRWKAAHKTGVDFVATDMYEAFNEARKKRPEAVDKNRSKY